MNPRPVLHVPEEPTTRADDWLAQVHAGRSIDDVLTGANGPISWFWSRWRSLATTGFSEEDLAQVVLGYRREIWLWLVGERVWAQCCSGLIGRVNRRLDERAVSGV